MFFKLYRVIAYLTKFKKLYDEKLQPYINRLYNSLEWEKQSPPLQRSFNWLAFIVPDFYFLKLRECKNNRLSWLEWNCLKYFLFQGHCFSVKNLKMSKYLFLNISSNQLDLELEEFLPSNCLNKLDKNKAYLIIVWHGGRVDFYTCHLFSFKVISKTNKKYKLAINSDINILNGYIRDYSTLGGMNAAQYIEIPFDDLIKLYNKLREIERLFHMIHYETKKLEKKINSIENKLLQDELIVGLSEVKKMYNNLFS